MSYWQVADLLADRRVVDEVERSSGCLSDSSLPCGKCSEPREALLDEEVPSIRPAVDGRTEFSGLSEWPTLERASVALR